MNKQKLGLTIFWIGIIYLLILAGLGGWGESLIVVKMSSIMGSPAFFLWAFSVPIGLILSSIGILLYVQAKGSKIALFGIGMALVVFLTDILLRDFLIARDAHYPVLFGMGGSLILIMFSGLIWFWAKKRNTFKNEAKIVADLELAGYGFFLIATWFICGAFAVLFNESMSSYTPRSPLNIMIYLALGWLFILISNYKAAQIDK
jgi:hypothetical protein